jgi:hypothetical protein
MKLILISSSAKKAPGGQPNHPSSRLKVDLSPAAYRQLKSAAQAVHDLLPEKFRSMLSPWPDPKIAGYHPYTFPAPGQGTGFERPTVLKALLSS